MKKLYKILMIFAFVLTIITKVEARPSAKILVNGIDITEKAQAINKHDRTLVPVRFVSEALQKEVRYIDYSKEVIVEDVNGKMTLQINSKLIELPDGTFYLSDVPAEIINNRTYVPVRVIAESFNMQVLYDNMTNTISIVEGTPNPDDSYYVDGFKDDVNGVTNFTVIAGKNIAPRIKSSKLFLLDSITKKGYLNSVSNDNNLTYTPWKGKDFGIILVASYDQNGNIVAGRGKKVTTNLVPEVAIRGVNSGDIINGAAELMPELNFIPVSLSYTVVDNSTNTAQKFENKDPFAAWQFEVPGGETRNVQVTMNAVDIAGNNYISNPVSFTIFTEKRFSLTGVKSGQNINGTVNLNVNRNFEVQSTRYYLGTPLGEKLLKELPYGGYIFNPGEELNGNYYLRAEVTLPNGEVLSTEKINVNIKGGKRLLLKGIGPNAVITDNLDLSYDSNVPAMSVTYVFEGTQGFTIKGIVGGKTSFTPTGKASGQYNVYVKTKTASGELASDKVSVKIHNEKTYGPTPIVPKDQFIEKFSPLAISSMNKTGMAASIQMAQAILETGWGQYVPVDKYSGKISKNLFGIKGTGSNGYIVSNTWEEYNGVKYRIDDKFRAYKTVEESWQDHKDLLLTKERYQIFRDVMFDPIRGAFAIRRAGYATDSEYPGKLIKIIKDNNLRKLDEVSF
ncbi:MAG: stalk domain-containing protein [Ezakiella sp.]|nr:stalk domain-containing protein [Ezakiella sp.]MDD7472439.1 stalk domain-containing protein [Bacillota bacterium]MDY3923173.1 stalk domain-containing protein [Ezakiella sp.]